MKIFIPENRCNTPVAWIKKQGYYSKEETSFKMYLKLEIVLPC